MQVELLNQVTPIHLIGESHTVAFNNLIFKATNSNDAFICRSKFIPLIPANKYGSETSVNADFLKALISEGLIAEKFMRPYYQHLIDAVAFYQSMPLIAPPIVFFFGDTELQSFLTQFGSNFDFELPDDSLYGMDSEKDPIPYTIIRNHLEQLISPAIAVLRQLKNVGFTRLMVHSLPPRSIDDKAASKWIHGIIISSQIRSKLAVLINRYLESACKDIEIGFINTWLETSQDGYIKSEFELDGLHVNKRAAVISLEKIADYLFDHTKGIFNPMRYQKALDQAEEYISIIPENTDWDHSGMAIGLLDQQTTLELKSALDFSEESEASFSRPDWTGLPSCGRDGVYIAEPSDAVLNKLESLYSEGYLHELMHAGSKKQLTFTNCRPVLFSPNSTYLSSLYQAPPACRCAILILEDTNRIVFERFDGKEIKLTCDNVVIESGTIFVFDPIQVEFRIKSGDTPALLIEMALMPRLVDQPFRAVWAGQCNWPADPYQHSLTRVRACPPYELSFFSQRCDL